MKLERVFAIFFACPVLMGVAGFLLGSVLPVPAARFQFHQAQGFLFDGLAVGFGVAVFWVAAAFAVQIFRANKSRGLGFLERVRQAYLQIAQRNS